jgi:hypothetical protein
VRVAEIDMSDGQLGEAGIAGRLHVLRAAARIRPTCREARRRGRALYGWCGCTRLGPIHRRTATLPCSLGPRERPSCPFPQRTGLVVGRVASPADAGLTDDLRRARFRRARAAGRHWAHRLDAHDAHRNCPR